MATKIFNVSHQKTFSFRHLIAYYTPLFVYAIIIMADDFQAMLSTIGEKFDISFDENEQQGPQIAKMDHQKSINPENRIEISQSIDMNNAQHKEQLEKSEDNHTEKHNKSLPLPTAVSCSQDMPVEVPFLPLLENDDDQQIREEDAQGKPVLVEGETGGHFSCEQEENEYYRSLSQKFEEALNKAHSRKSISSSYQGQFMERQEHYLKKKQTGMQQLLMEKERRQSRQLRGKPLINSYSQQILPHYTPIDKRYPAVLAQKKRKVEMWQAEQKKQAEQAKDEELREIERWNQIVKERVGEARSSEEYYENQQRWSEKRYKNIEENAKKQDESMRSQISFKPKINQRSDNMMKKKIERVPIYEKQPQLKKLAYDPHCTFKPNLSKTLKRIS